MIGKKDTVAIFQNYKSVIEEQTGKPAAFNTNDIPTNTKQTNVGGILKQIRSEVDSEDLNKALEIIQRSTLPSNVKLQMDQLLKNSNVIEIYKQIKQP
jgi:hypothetical protein